MKMYRSILTSFGWSLLLGILIFCIIPITCLLLSRSNDSDFYTVFIVLYGIYIFIQLGLSVINLVQVHFYEEKCHQDIDFTGLFERFLIAETILYLMIFILLSLAFGFKDSTLLVFCFSIPYIICCTVSIFLSIHFINKQIIAESNEN